MAIILLDTSLAKTAILCLFSCFCSETTGFDTLFTLQWSVVGCVVLKCVLPKVCYLVLQKICGGL